MFTFLSILSCVDSVCLLAGPVGERCDKCVCSAGTVTCNPPECPIQRLQCVDPALDNNCNYMCPQGTHYTLISFLSN